jgi:tetratricopeptide (TPR) repeat protein
LFRSQKTGSAEDSHEAAKEFEQELQLDPANGDAAYELAEINRNGGQFEDAQKYFEPALGGILISNRPGATGSDQYGLSQIECAEHL